MELLSTALLLMFAINALLLVAMKKLWDKHEMLVANFMRHRDKLFVDTESNRSKIFKLHTRNQQNEIRLNNIESHLKRCNKMHSMAS